MCLVAQSYPTLCDPVDCSPSSSLVYGILETRKLEWTAISPLENLPDPGIEPTSPESPALAGKCFTCCAFREAYKIKVMNSINKISGKETTGNKERSINK